MLLLASPGVARNECGSTSSAVPPCAMLVCLRIASACACTVHSQLQPFSLQKLLQEPHISAHFCLFAGALLAFACCLLVVAIPWTFHVHKAPGHPSLGSGRANPQHACSWFSLNTGGLANPAVRISRAEVPTWSSAERQVFSVEIGEPAPKMARFARVAASTLDGAGACDLGGSTSLRRIEDSDRRKFCKAWAIVARGCLQWSSLGLADVKEIHLERLFEDRAASTLRKHLSGW